jgi:hypothetical protein
VGEALDVVIMVVMVLMEAILHLIQLHQLVVAVVEESHQMEIVVDQVEVVHLREVEELLVVQELLDRETLVQMDMDLMKVVEVEVLDKQEVYLKVGMV